MKQRGWQWKRLYEIMLVSIRFTSKGLRTSCDGGGCDHVLDGRQTLLCAHDKGRRRVGLSSAALRSLMRTRLSGTKILLASSNRIITVTGLSNSDAGQQVAFSNA